MTSATRTLKSASVFASDGGQAKSIQICELTGASPAPSPVRLFSRHHAPTAADFSAFSGGAVPITAIPPVPMAEDHPNSTEQTVTHGPATGGRNDFRKEEQQHIEE